MGRNDLLIRTFPNTILSKNKKYTTRIISLSGGQSNLINGKTKFFYTGKESWINNINGSRFPFRSGIKHLDFILHAMYVFLVLIRYRPHYVVCTGFGQLVYANKIRNLFGLKYKLLSWPHFSIASGFGNIKYSTQADYCLGISKEINDEFIKACVEPEKVIYFPNPFSRMDIIKRKNDITTFVFIGRLLIDGQKRIRDIIDAAGKINGDFRVKFIGDGEDADLIEKYIKNSPANKKLELLRGWVNDPWRLAGNPNALLLASAFEGLPTVIGEAMSRGIVCISSDCKTGPRDFIKDGRNGYLFPVGDVDSLANLMQRVVDGDINPSPEIIAESIDFFYEDRYEERLLKVFN
ncbi:UDP-D-galactose:(glucosyl)lipopolysaccharide-1%2 C6-D-galactosyltransferase [Serratia marcescens]|nr:UDP-D-galactose:(glucosyl)lipopolysaccharide-1%2 C6-D-galactosyltransferase [Serratia marcescens]